MRGGMGALLGALMLVMVAGAASAAAAPVVTAGLDQDVLMGDTVYLDGSPTHVPNGELDGLEWSIEAPDGTEMTPECGDCELTSFKPAQTGQYNVTLTARSESGIERSDTLYVRVEGYNPTPEPVGTTGSTAGTEPSTEPSTDEPDTRTTSDPCDGWEATMGYDCPYDDSPLTISTDLDSPDPDPRNPESTPTDPPTESPNDDGGTIETVDDVDIPTGDGLDGTRGGCEMEFETCWTGSESPLEISGTDPISPSDCRGGGQNWNRVTQLCNTGTVDGTQGNGNVVDDSPSDGSSDGIDGVREWEDEFSEDSNSSGSDGRGDSDGSDESDGSENGDSSSGPSSYDPSEDTSFNGRVQTHASDNHPTGWPY